LLSLSNRHFARLRALATNGKSEAKRVSNAAA